MKLKTILFNSCLKNLERKKKLLNKTLYQDVAVRKIITFHLLSSIYIFFSHLKENAFFNSLKARFFFYKHFLNKTLLYYNK